MTFDLSNALFLFVAAIVGSVLSFMAVRSSGKSTVQAKEVEVDAAAYGRAEAINMVAFARMQAEIDAVKASHEAQGKEIKDLRTSVDKVNRVFQIAMNFIEQFLLWERDGSRPPRPNIPAELKEYLDPALIREHRRQQAGDVTH
jgi:hypothetical protein